MDFENIGRQLDGAMWVRFDEEHRVIMSWQGGHGIHAYDESGREIAFWNIGDWSGPAATLQEVRASMAGMLENHNYGDFA